MKIKFNNDREYEVLSVYYHTDEKGIPVDIVITGEDEEVLYNIADEQGLLGFNIQQLKLDIDTFVYEALYGRLNEFTCTEYETATFGLNIIDYCKDKNKTNENNC